MRRMSQRLTWRDGPASRKTEGAEEFGMVKVLQTGQRDGAQGPERRVGQKETRDIIVQEIIRQ